MNKATEATARRKREQDERVAAHIQRLVESWPPLTDSQRDRLAFLLRPPTPDARPAVERMLGGER